LPVLLSLVFSCRETDFTPDSGSAEPYTPPARGEVRETRKVMVMYSAGFNSISYALSQDLREMAAEGFVPEDKTRADHILLVFSRQNTDGYSNPQAPVLYRLYKDAEGTVVQDTLLRFKPEDQATDPAVLREVMDFARDRYPASGYGLVVSSHACGWLPSKNSPSAKSVKSIMQDADTGNIHEMELGDFVSALPYRLDYVMLDACFMGCVEVAWALREKARWVGFSPTEIMSDGFNYLTLADRLLRSEPDALGVCTDYFAQYTDPRQGSPYASITLVDAGAMQPLADICKTLFERYRGPISRLSKTQVQRYFRWNQNPRFEHLYDLRHMLQQAGATEADLAQFDAALKKCVLYEAHTERFMSLWLTNVCGLSVYLPSSGDDDLNQYYMNQVEWNNATELIK
jgi:hypothetical protein